MDEVVKVTEAESEAEASMICGFLESHGVPATYDKGGVSQPMLGFAFYAGEAYTGRQEILVRANDAQRAAQLLATLPR